MSKKPLGNLSESCPILHVYLIVKNRDTRKSEGFRKNAKKRNDSALSSCARSLLSRTLISSVISFLWACKRVSTGLWLLRLSAKILALLRLSVNFFQLRLTEKLKINFFCFKKLNID